MTIGDHVAEIARQGVWASLTGGWCYEPTNSIFCNTVHLYVWGVLLLLPLLLGVFTGGLFHWTLCALYVGFVLALFAVFKLVTAYLHGVFDKTEPMIAMKTRKATTADTFRSPVSSFSTTRRETSNVEAGQMVEMVEMNSNSRADEPRDSGATANQVSFGNFAGFTHFARERFDISRRNFWQHICFLSFSLFQLG